MKPINETHVAEPGLAVVEVAAADDETAFTIQKLLATPCAVAQADRTTRELGEPGVRLRCYLDLSQEPDSQLRNRPPGCRAGSHRYKAAVPRKQVVVVPPTQTVPSGSAVMVMSPARPSRAPWETL